MRPTCQIWHIKVFCSSHSSAWTALQYGEKITLHFGRLRVKYIILLSNKVLWKDNYDSSIPIIAKKPRTSFWCLRSKIIHPFLGDILNPNFAEWLTRSSQTFSYRHFKVIPYFKFFENSMSGTTDVRTAWSKDTFFFLTVIMTNSSKL